MQEVCGIAFAMFARGITAMDAAISDDFGGCNDVAQFHRFTESIDRFTGPIDYCTGLAYANFRLIGHWFCRSACRLSVTAGDSYALGDPIAYVGFEPADRPCTQQYRAREGATFDVEINGAAGKSRTGLDLLEAENREALLD
jgi:hypothetical protein